MSNVTYQRSAVHNVSDIQAIADHAGSFFFTPNAMRFFSSRVLSGIRALDGNDAVDSHRFLFVTSEKYGDDAPRHYTLRLATLGVQRDNRPAIDIQTVGDKYATARAARAAMNEYKGE